MTVRLCVLDILDLMAFGIKSEASSKKTNNQRTNIFLVVSKYTWTLDKYVFSSQVSLTCMKVGP